MNRLSICPQPGIVRIASLLITAGILTGCVGYRLGSMLPADIKTVFVPTITNSSLEPNIESEITQSIVEQLQQDGSLRVINDEAAADSVLKVDVFDYRLEPLGYDDAQTSRTDEYRIRITARAMLVRQPSGEVVTEHPRLQGKTEFLFTGDLTSTKRQNLPNAADDLAHDIVEMIVEAWQ